MAEGIPGGSSSSESTPPKTSLMALTGLCPGKTTNMGKSRFRARHTFLTALHTVALLKCSASPTLYKKLQFAKKRSATHNICCSVSHRPRTNVWCGGGATARRGAARCDAAAASAHEFSFYGTFDSVTFNE